MEKALTREEILGASNLKIETVDIKEWGGSVIIRELTAAARDEYESSVVKTDGLKVRVDSSNMRAKLVALSVVDKSGKLLFTKKDVVALGELSATAIDRVVDVARRLSGIGDTELEEAGND